MLKLITLLAAIIGLVGLVFCILAISIFVHPAAPLSLVLWFSLAAYVVIIMITLTGMTLIELLIVIGLITITTVGAIFALDDMISDNIRLLMWSVVCGAWYLPVFVLSLGRILDTEHPIDEAISVSGDDQAQTERQNLINKSLARRRRKQARRNKI
jgi:hypothetical protein